MKPPYSGGLGSLSLDNQPITINTITMAMYGALTTIAADIASITAIMRMNLNSIPIRSVTR